MQPKGGVQHLLIGVRLRVLLNYKAGHWKFSRSDHNCLQGYTPILSPAEQVMSLLSPSLTLSQSDPSPLFPSSLARSSCFLTNFTALTFNPPDPPFQLQRQGAWQMHLCPWEGVVTQRGFWDADLLRSLDLCSWLHGCARFVKIPEVVDL